LGNAAIAGIEHENQVAEQKQLQASIEKLQATQSAELGAGTDAFEAQTGQMASDYINSRAQATLNQEFAGTEQSLESQLAAMPDPSLVASVAAVNGAGTVPKGTVTVGSLEQISWNGDPGYAARKAYRDSYIANALAENQDIGTSGGAGMDPVTAQMVSDYQAGLAQQQYFDNLDAADGHYLATLPLKMIAGAWKTTVNSAYAWWQEVEKGQEITAANQIEFASGIESLTGQTNNSTQSDASANALLTDAMQQPIYVPYTNLSPEEQFGGDVAMVLGLVSVNPEEDVGLMGNAFRVDGAFGLDASGLVPDTIGAPAAEALASQRAYVQAFNSDGTLVIGRLPDTAVGSELGMTRLDSLDWTPNVNDAWVQGGIDAEKPFYLGSPIKIGNLRSGDPIYPTTVYFRELQQLRAAGYYREGDFMLPPNGN